MAEHACADCGTVLNEGGELTFTVCDACWDKAGCPRLLPVTPNWETRAQIAEAEIERLRQLYDDEVAITRRVLADDMRQIDALRARVRELEADIEKRDRERLAEWVKGVAE